MLDRIDIKFFKLAVGEENIHSETLVDVSARCPVCGDSHRGTKARLHLYAKNNLTFVNCFNGGCPVENKIPFTFFRDFFPELLSSYKRETFHLRLNDLKEEFGSKEQDTSPFISLVSDSKQEPKEFEDVFASLGSKKPEKTKEITGTKNPTCVENTKETIEVPFELTTLRLETLLKTYENSRAQEYLESRGVTYEPQKHGRFYYSENNITLDDKVLYVKDSIVIPLYFKNEIYGFYSRSITQKDFYTFIFREQGFKAWNYFNLKKNEPVYVFEGIFDAMSSGLDNICASLGAKISDEMIKILEDNGSEVIFVLDSDKTGLMNSLEYSKRGYKVFVPPTNLLKKDINTLRNTYSTEEIKDIIQNNLYSGVLGTVKINQLL